MRTRKRWFAAVLGVLALTLATVTTEAVVDPSTGPGAGQRRGPDAADGLEQLEHLRLQHQRDADPPDGRRDRQQRHAGPGLPVRRRRRLLVQPQPRRGGQPAGRPDPVPERHEGARRLPARPGPEVRHLPGAAGQDLRAVLRQLPRRHRQPGPRGAGRPAVRRLGRGLPQVRLVLAQRHASTSRSPTFARMRDALAATGRPIVYSINPNSIHAKTGPQRNWGDVANMWRTTEDITNAWDTGQTNGYPMGIQNIVNVTVPLAALRRPGRFNDPDMMEVGRGGMTDTEMRSHFALWAMMASPLIAGNDLRSHVAATLTILKNQNLIAINQDSLGAAGGPGRPTTAPAGCWPSGWPTATSRSPCSTRAARPRRSPPPRRRSARRGSSFTLRDAWTNATSTTTGTISASVPGARHRGLPGQRRRHRRPAAADHVPAAQRGVRPLPGRRPNGTTANGTQHVDLGLPRRRQPAVGPRTARRCRSSASAWTPRPTPPPARGCRSGTATAAPTSSGRSTPTARSATSGSGAVPGRQRRRAPPTARP